MLLQRRREKRLAQTDFQDIGKSRLEWFQVSQVVDAGEQHRGLLNPEVAEQKWLHTYFYDILQIPVVLATMKVLPVKLNLRGMPGVLLGTIPGGKKGKKFKK